LVRDLKQFPDLLAEVRDAEIRRVRRGAARWLAEQEGTGGPERDWEALGTLLVNAVAHYWLLADVFGEPPDGIAEGRYIAALAELAAALFTSGAGQ
jgi:hypothetical protein